MLCYQYTTSSIEGEYIDIYIVLVYNVLYVVVTPVRHEIAFQGVFRGPRSFLLRPRPHPRAPRAAGRHLHRQAAPSDDQREEPDDPHGRSGRRLRHRQRAGRRHPLRVGVNLHLALLPGVPGHHRDPIPADLQAGVQADAGRGHHLRAGAGVPAAGVRRRPLGAIGPLKMVRRIGSI